MNARALPPLSALRAFEAAARHRSAKRAADELSVTATAISHQLRALEDWLGVPLFVRKPRQLELTAAGRELVGDLGHAFDTMAAAVNRRQRQVAGAGGAQAVRQHLRAGVQPDAEAQARAGPAAPQAAALRDLCRQKRALGWPEWQKRAKVPGLDASVGTVFSDETHTVAAALAGQGIALMSRALIGDELRRGTLVCPFGPELKGEPFHLVYPDARRGDAAVQAVTEWVMGLVPLLAA